MYQQRKRILTLQNGFAGDAYKEVTQLSRKVHKVSRCLRWKLVAKLPRSPGTSLYHSHVTSNTTQSRSEAANSPSKNINRSCETRNPAQDLTFISLTIVKTMDFLYVTRTIAISSISGNFNRPPIHLATD